MKLKNLTQKTFIAENVQVLDSLLAKTLGLLFKPQGTIVAFKTRFGIHTFFMKYPIDILILDKNLIVKKICQNIQPNRLLFWNPKYPYVIELPIKSQKVKLEDQLKLEL